jgi:putative addiction module CopG family antidote
MRIELPDQLEAYIQYKIDVGLYSNGAEVIRDALRRMMEHDEEAARTLRLREALQTGADQITRGEGEPYTPALMQSLKEQARTRATRGERPKPEVAE